MTDKSGSKRLLQFLMRLPWAREDAIYLNRCGCGYGAISEGLGISINTVKSWIRRHKAKRTTAKEDKAPKEGKAAKGDKTPKVKAKPKAYRYGYNHAKDAEEWVKHLHTQALPYYFGKMYDTKIPV